MARRIPSLARSPADLNKLDEVLNACPGITMVCIDVANGYSEHFVDAVKQARDLAQHQIRCPSPTEKREGSLKLWSLVCEAH